MKVRIPRNVTDMYHLKFFFNEKYTQNRPNGCMVQLQRTVKYIAYACIIPKAVMVNNTENHKTHLCV